MPTLPRHPWLASLLLLQAGTDPRAAPLEREWGGLGPHGYNPTLYASPPFATPVLRCGDLDGDGDPDLVYAGGLADGSPALAVSENQGHPAHAVMGAARLFAQGNPGWSTGVRPTLWDGDGDGRMDLAYVSEPGRDLRLRPRDAAAADGWGPAQPLAPGATASGIGFFSPPVPAFPAHTPPGLTVCLVAGPVEANTPSGYDVEIHAFAGPVNGPLTRTRLASLHDLGVVPDAFGSQPVVMDLRLVDLDGDGDDDALLLAALERAGRRDWGLWRLYNEAAPGQPLPSFPSIAFAADTSGLPNLEGSQSVEVADLNHDGAPELVTSEAVHWGLRTGGGLTWPRREEDVLGIRPGFWPDPVTADLNRDGLLDLLVSTMGDDGVQRYQVRLNLGTRGSWIMGRAQPLPDLDGSDYSLAAMADFDGDGFPDGFRVDDGGAPFWARHRGGPDLSWEAWDAPPAAWNLPPDLTSEYAFGDVDGDGDPDLIYSAYLDDTRAPALCLNTGSVAHLRLAPPVVDWGGFTTARPGRVFQQPRILASPLPGRASLVFATRSLDESVYAIQCLCLEHSDIAAPVWTEAEALLDIPESGLDRFAPADFEGDGDVDLLLIAGTDPGLRRLVNPSPLLPVKTSRVSLHLGQTQDLFAYALAPANQVRLLENRSGAVLDPGTGEYQAGPQPGLDVAELSDADGLRALLYLNVMDTTPAPSSAQAILVAGGKAHDDPVWAATDRIGNRAYDVLRLLGIPRGHLDYLSFLTGRDLDGNGLDDDIDRESSLASMDQAFLAATARGPGTLYVCLVDHGSTSATNAYLRLNGSELLSATDLKHLLDRHQDATGGDVVVILDFCYAGAFLPLLHNPAHTNRLVLASCAPDQLAYFIARGLVSFSDLFMNAVLTGADLSSAFRSARAGMSSYQTALIDANADGLADPVATGEDGENRPFATAPTVGRDLPQIGAISPNQDVARGQSFTIWAEGVGGPFPLAGVWAVVVPPDGLPAPESGNPVVDLPEIPLYHNPDTGRHEAVLGPLGQPGLTKIVLFARDIWGGVSFPRQCVIRQDALVEKAVVLHSGQAATPSASAAARVVRTLRGRLLDEGNIRLLGASPLDVDGDGADDLSGPATTAALLDAVSTWAGNADRLTVVLLGPASHNRLLLDAPLDPPALAAALDTHLAAGPARSQVVLLDYAGAGAGVAALAASNRVVLASSAPNRDVVDQEGASFTTFFFSGIAVGRTVGEAAREARLAIRRFSGNLRQKVLADDDGDGRANEKGQDLLRADSLGIGAAFLTGDDLPGIGLISPEDLRHPAGTPFLLFAEDVTDADGIAAVWCDVSPPTNHPGRVTVRHPLTPTPGGRRWEHLLPPLPLPGTYTLSFAARDTRGEVSALRQSRVVITPAHLPVRGPEAEPDYYDGGAGDDSPALASRGDMPLSQFHTLHHAGDCDWLLFHALSNRVYDVETRHLTPGLDTHLSLFQLLPGGDLRLVEEVDENGVEMGELTGLTFPEEGFYLVRVCSGAPPGAFVPGEYEVLVYSPSGSGFGGLMISALSLGTLSLLPDAEISVFRGDGSGPIATALANASTYVFFPLQPGHYLIRVTPPGGALAVGYAPATSPSLANESPDNPLSDYGNPRALNPESFATAQLLDTGISGDIYAMFFAFDEYATLTGSVASAFFNTGLAGATLRVEQPGQVALDRHPWSGNGTPWITGTGGQLPPSVRVRAGLPATVTVLAPGHAPVTQTIPATALVRGAVVALNPPILPAVDQNANTIPDPWEFLHLGGPAPAHEDPDRDALDNLAEYQAGTDPADPASVHRFIAGTHPHPTRLRWPATAHREYRVWSTDASPPQSGWRLRESLPASATPPSHWEWTDPESLPPHRFYRVDVQIPSP